MDCVEGLKHYADNYFDLAICDPPYGIGFDGSRESTSKHGGRKGCRQRIGIVAGSEFENGMSVTMLIN